MDFNAAKVLKSCKMGSALKQLMYMRMGSPTELSAGKALILWLFELVTSSRLFELAPSSEESVLALFNHAYSVIEEYGNKLEQALLDKSAALPISEMLICDRRYVGVIGCEQLIDMHTGELVQDAKVGQFLERINYSLATLYIRRRTLYSSEIRNANNTLTDTTAST